MGYLFMWMWAVLGWVAHGMDKKCGGDSYTTILFIGLFALAYIATTFSSNITFLCAAVLAYVFINWSFISECYFDLKAKAGRPWNSLAHRRQRDEQNKHKYDYHERSDLQ